MLCLPHMGSEAYLPYCLLFRFTNLQAVPLLAGELICAFVLCNSCELDVRSKGLVICKLKNLKQEYSVSNILLLLITSNQKAYNVS